MNERIKQLAEQAASETSTAKFSHMSFQERFSNLIIEKCAKIAWANTPDYEELECGHLIGDKIKEYFGVE